MDVVGARAGRVVEPVLGVVGRIGQKNGIESRAVKSPTGLVSRIWSR